MRPREGIEHSLGCCAPGTLQGVEDYLEIVGLKMAAREIDPDGYDGSGDVFNILCAAMRGLASVHAGIYEAKQDEFRVRIDSGEFGETADA